MTPQIYEKFSETNNWLLNAIIEKVHGRSFNHNEILDHVTIEHDKTTQENKVYLDKKLIMTSFLKIMTETVDDEVVNTSCHGEFNIPKKYMDDYIKDRATNWMR